VVVAENIAHNPNSGLTAYSVSNDGILVYRTGASTVANQLLWLDRTGKRLRTFDPAGGDTNPRLSPDRKRLAVAREVAGTPANVWLVDLMRGVSSPFTFGNSAKSYPLWSPDGRRIAFNSSLDLFGAGPDVYQRLSNGAGTDEPLFKSPSSIS